MKRIYIDSNIFRFIKEGHSETHSLLSQKLESFKDRLIYFYSPAHLLDLTEDKTPTKFKDLEFMAQFVQNNFLTLEKGEEFVSLSSIFPLDAFNNILNYTNEKENLDIQTLIDKYLVIPEKEKLDKTIHLGLSTKFKNVPSSAKDILKQIYPDIKDEYSADELISSFKDLIQRLYTTPETFKSLRRYSIEELKLKAKHQINIKDASFNEALQDTALQKTFLEFVSGIFQSNNIQHQKEFNYFITAYSSLNLLAIDNEKNKKIKFASTAHDSIHSFFAAHCDHLITDDKGLYQKSKTLYNLFKINTQVLTVQEFIDSFNQISEPIDTNKFNYLNFLIYDLKHSKITNTEESIANGTIIITRRTIQSHFNYFNYVKYVDAFPRPPYYVLYKDHQNLSQFNLVSEISSVINKMAKLLGSDISKRKNLSEFEIAELQEGKWEGRIWMINTYLIYLIYDYKVQKLLFYFKSQ